MNLTKARLITRVQDYCPGLTRVKAVEAVETFLQTIKASLENGDDVLLSGFGKFTVKDKAARRGRNPKTGKSMVLNARRVVTFKTSGKLRQKVNGK